MATGQTGPHHCLRHVDAPAPVSVVVALRAWLRAGKPRATAADESSRLGAVGVNLHAIRLSICQRAVRRQRHAHRRHCAAGRVPVPHHGYLAVSEVFVLPDSKDLLPECCDGRDWQQKDQHGRSLAPSVDGPPSDHSYCQPERPAGAKCHQRNAQAGDAGQ